MSKLLPPNATKLEKNIEKQGEKISLLRVPFVELNHITQCPVAHLPWLAWAHRVEYWRADWTESEKRTAIIESKAFNEQRGTKASIQSLLATVIDEFQLKAWHQFNPPQQPFSFVVTISSAYIISVDQLQQILTAVEATKSARDTFSISAKVQIFAKFIVAGGSNYGQTVYMSTLE